MSLSPKKLAVFDLLKMQDTALSFPEGSVQRWLADMAGAYEQSFFALTHIAYLQAFTDTNKRTSCLSANIPLIINNLVPFSFNDIESDDYLSALIDNDHQSSFKEDLDEDLSEISPQRISGMGISSDEFEKWIKLRGITEVGQPDE